MPKKKQKKRHKSAKKSKPAGPKNDRRGRMADGSMPKYLTEPDISTRRSAHWALMDLRAIRERKGEICGSWEEVMGLLGLKLVKDYKDRSKVLNQSAVKTTLQLMNQRVRTRGHEMVYAARQTEAQAALDGKAIEAKASLKLGAMQAAVDRDSGQEMTLEKVVKAIMMVHKMDKADEEVGDDAAVA